MLAYVFPGQGAQKKGMGEELFNSFPALVQKADAILGFSIRELCLTDPRNSLNQTAFTQPALYVVNCLTWLAEKDKSGTAGDYLAGHSLGEYAALFAAGVFDFETGLRLVQKRGALMSQAQGGGMAAVIGLTADRIRQILDQHGLQTVDIANHNTPGQLVISGIKAEIDKAKPLLESNGAKTVIPLNVSGAFHSRYMEPAYQEFKSFLESFELRPPVRPVLANVTARPYNAHELKDTLAKQITHAVQWTDTIRYLLGKGVTEFKECGPGNVLTKLIDKIKQEATPLIIADEPPAGQPLKANLSTADAQSNGKIRAENLGSAEFKRDYGVKYAHYAGAMVRGIASKEMVVKLANAGLMGSLGTGGVSLAKIEEDIRYIQSQIKPGAAYCLNILNNLEDPKREWDTISIYLKYGIKVIEAAAYIQVSEALARYRLTGLSRTGSGAINCAHHIIAKVSRPEVAASFLSPAPEKIVQQLLAKGAITGEQAELARSVPMADDICVEADSGGHTDGGVAYTLMPALQRLRDDKMKEHNYARQVRIGAGGGIGAPGSAAAAFVMGADFITTGSINQCTVEAGQSTLVKDILQTINVQDTAYAPAGDMFELGAQVQVLRKGVFFPARANKLYELYSRYNSLDEIDEKTKVQLQEKYFKKSFADIWADTKKYFADVNPDEITKAEKNPKHKMALVFRWYFFHATKTALEGNADYKVDFQVHCGPALGAFNQWVKGTELEPWQNRYVDSINTRLLLATADYLNEQYLKMQGK